MRAGDKLGLRWEAGAYSLLGAVIALTAITMRSKPQEAVVISVNQRLVSATASQLISTLDSTTAYLYAREIVRWSSLAPPQLTAVQMLLESRGNPDAMSSAGAVGLMQIMPNIWGRVFPQCGSELMYWRTNICYGMHVLSYYLRVTDGNVTHALNLYWGRRQVKASRYTREIEERLRS